MGLPVINVVRSSVEMPPIAQDTVVRGRNCFLHMAKLQREWGHGEREELLSILELCRDAEAMGKEDSTSRWSNC